MTFKQLIKSIFEHMSKMGMLDDLNKKYLDEEENYKTIRSENSGAQ